MKKPDSNEKNWAVFSHILTLFGCVLPGTNLLIPFLIWYQKKDQSMFIAHHAKESLNFQITVTLVIAIWGLLNAVLIGLLFLPLIPFAVVFALIFVIRASMKASRGDEYRYPVCLRLVN
ncbi:DUF4870 domain-containing protein [Endozoicomonas sp. ALD040]|uniref:DUF4870 domain-containing protein n=1 Tax=unclassified Endozoicomonas TaxID=2644528 RepID=UPI003BAE48FF